MNGSPTDIDESCDVVVVGSGGGGLAAAVTAAANGMRVIVLEKTEVYGGITAIAGGGSWIAANPVAAREGIEDDVGKALEYFRQSTGNAFDLERVSAFLTNGPRMVDFFERNTSLKFYSAVDRPDYHPNLPGAAAGGRTIFPLPFDARLLGKEVKRLRPPAAELTFLGIMIRPGPELQHFLRVFRSFESTRIVARKILRLVCDVIFHGRSMDLSNGNALIGRLAKSAFDLGVEIRTNAAAVELVRTSDCIAAIRVRQPDGMHKIAVQRGVILAAGGFSHDAERRRQFYRHAPTGQEHYSPAPEGNTGDGLRMAESIGAVIGGRLSNAAGWAPVSLVPKGKGKFMAFPHLIDRQKPGFIAVTRSGRRFVNEAESYHEFGKGLAAACEGESEAVSFLVCDHRTIRRYGMGFVRPAPLPMGANLRSGYLFRGRSLEELAKRCGIDAPVFVATVKEFNRHAREGTDPEFHRGESSYNRYNGDRTHRPNPCLAPIEIGPFYAVKIHMGELGTFAGIVTDARARALDADGKAIAGLYAAGNDQSHVMAGDYMGGGATLGPALTFGYIAGCEIAGESVPINVPCAASSNPSIREEI
jgi:succinate dehydrogenase/fumarate reductase flavoprotein subunit